MSLATLTLADFVHHEIDVKKKIEMPAFVYQRISDQILKAYSIDVIIYWQITYVCQPKR